MIRALLIHTNEISGVGWNVQGMIQYVNSEDLKKQYGFYFLNSFLLLDYGYVSDLFFCF